MTLKQIETKKAKLLTEVKKLSDKKIKLYSKIDISKPMSKDEKELTKKISDLFSEINNLVIQKRNLLKK